MEQLYGVRMKHVATVIGGRRTFQPSLCCLLQRDFCFAEHITYSFKDKQDLFKPAWPNLVVGTSKSCLFSLRWGEGERVELAGG